MGDKPFINFICLYLISIDAYSLCLIRVVLYGEPFSSKLCLSPFFYFERCTH